jgi:hypothetical protein
MNARLTIGIIGSTFLTFSTPTILQAQPSDFNFGTSRVPRRNCPPQVEPTRGAITAAQATLYAACNGEKKKNNYSVQFVDIRNVKIIRSRVPDYGDIRYFGQKVDTSKPAYEITGNVVSYDCYNIIPKTGLINHKAGQNCITYQIPEALGSCIKTVFSKWECRIDTADTERKQGPPPAN